MESDRLKELEARVANQDMALRWFASELALLSNRLRVLNGEKLTRLDFFANLDAFRDQLHVFIGEERGEARWWHKLASPRKERE